LGLIKKNNEMRRCNPFMVKKAAVHLFSKYARLGSIKGGIRTVNGDLER
jgi:hypothetical protein